MKSPRTAPQVPTDALSARNSAACEHSDVPGSGEQQDGAEEEAHAGWGSSFIDAAGVVEGVSAQGDSRNCASETDEKRTPVNKTCACSAASSKPGRADQVEGANATDDIALPEISGWLGRRHWWPRSARQR